MSGTHVPNAAVPASDPSGLVNASTAFNASAFNPFARRIRVAPLALKGPSAHVAGGGPFECLNCHMQFAAGTDEMEFTGRCNFPAGRWMVRDERLWHICHGYDEQPSATRKIPAGHVKRVGHLKRVKRAGV